MASAWRARPRLRVFAVGFVLSLALGAPPAEAGPPPSPLPWTRTYIAVIPLTYEQQAQEVIDACHQDRDHGVFDNGAWDKIRIGVVGDSVQNQTRAPALSDLAYRWTYLTHCGENLGTVASSGRLGEVLATNPEVLVGGFGTNNFSYDWLPQPSIYPAFITNFHAFLDRTDGVPCRVLFNISEHVADYYTGTTRDQWLSMIRQANSMFASIDPVAHPDVIVIDWDTTTKQSPWLLLDDQHLTRSGVNTRINLALSASRRCLVPDNPVDVHAVAGNGSATVWWDPLPEEEAVTTYYVTSSLGHVASSSQPTLNVSGLADGVPVSFRVRATNSKGTSTFSLPSETVTPSAGGSRFHALVPTRVLDTRDGTGGKGTPFGPGQSYQLSVNSQLAGQAANAAALVLNVTATGQTAQSFVTVWPGGQSRPLTSNLNPRPGVPATPAMVTTRAGPGGTIQLYNNSGSVHLVADVVGWFDQPGSGTGSLFNPQMPSRVLDTRDGTGGRATPFSNADSFTLDLDSLPSGATGAVVNVTSVNTTNAGFVTLYPAGTAQPLASNLNPAKGLTRANLTAVKVDSAGRIAIYNNTGSTDLVVDLVGHFGPEGVVTGGSEYFPITPERHFDSRDGTGGTVGPLSNAASTNLQFAGKGSIPSAAEVVAVDANVTVLGSSQDGHTTVWPSGDRPNASTLNFQRSEVVPNRDIAGLFAGSSKIWSSAGQIHYVIDVTGWYGPAI